MFSTIIFLVAIGLKDGVFYPEKIACIYLIAQVIRPNSEPHLHTNSQLLNVLLLLQQHKSIW